MRPFPQVCSELARWTMRALKSMDDVCQKLADAIL
jgi:hypothetical protein